VPADPGFSTVRTQRLTLRRFREADLDAFVAYRSDPDTARYQGWDSPYPVEHGRSFLAEMAALDPGAPGQWFQFAVEERTSGALVGDCALHCDAEDPTTAWLGFTVAPEHRGRGYATEAVRGLVLYACERLDACRVLATVDARNAPSIALLERVGFRRTATNETVFKGAPCQEHTYALDLPARP
jgi:RimJ/RimL family protein N-acetyltransferase